MRALVLQTEELDASASDWLAERVDLRRCAPDDPGFADLLARADALVVRTYTIVNEAMLAKAPKLRAVARAGVGLDNIDLRACERMGIRVLNTPDANTQAVVELVVSFVLDALRPRLFLDKALPLKEWKRVRDELIAPRQLGDLTVGVLGLGRVGTRVARVFEAFGCRVLYNDLLELRRDNLRAQAVDLDTLLRSSDVFTVHVDERAGNRDLIGARALSLLKPDALLINASRGFVVNPGRLASWRAHPARAGDPRRPRARAVPPGVPAARPAQPHPPHIEAWRRAQAKRNMSWVVKDLWKVLSGEKPEHAAV